MLALFDKRVYIASGFYWRTLYSIVVLLVVPYNKWSEMMVSIVDYRGRVAEWLSLAQVVQ